MAYTTGNPPAFPAVVDAGEAYQHLEFNQGDFPVVPVIWYVTPSYGYQDTVVTVVGMGFSRQYKPAATLQLWMDVQSDVSRPDVQVVPTGWVTTAAAGTPQIGSDGTTTQRDVLTLTLTSAMVFAQPEVNEFYIDGTLGRSNRKAITSYPRSDTPIPTTPPTNNSRAVTRLDVQVPYASLITEDYISFVKPDYVITGSYPEARPKALVLGTGYVRLLRDAYTEGLDDPVTTLLHFTNRFRPDTTKIAARPDLGTSASTWVPNGSATQRMVWYNETSPYVDENVSIVTRSGPKTRPAMVFDGVVSYARSLQDLVKDAAGNPLWTMMMAVRLFANAAKPRVTLMCTDAGQQNAGDYLIEVALVGNTALQLWAFGKTANVLLPPEYLSSRPIVVGVRATATVVQMYVLASRVTIAPVTIIAKKSTDTQYRPTGFYLGRNNDPGKMNLGRMEVLDFAYHSSTLDSATMLADMSAMDGAYGGSQS